GAEDRVVGGCDDGAAALPAGQVAVALRLAEAGSGGREARRERALDQAPARRQVALEIHASYSSSVSSGRSTSFPASDLSITSTRCSTSARRCASERTSAMPRSKAASDSS